MVQASGRTGKSNGDNTNEQVLCFKPSRLRGKYTDISAEYQQYIRHRYHAVSDLGQGELVFVTSRECRDLSPEQAESYILGYTIGNDISCRLHQLPEQGGGQYFFAKGFDKFAPIGPVLVSQKEFRKAQEIKLITKLNGEIMQEVECFRDFIWTPAQILSHMSQGQ